MTVFDHAPESVRRQAREDGDDRGSALVEWWNSLVFIEQELILSEGRRRLMLQRLSEVALAGSCEHPARAALGGALRAEATRQEPPRLKVSAVERARRRRFRGRQRSELLRELINRYVP